MFLYSPHLVLLLFGGMITICFVAVTIYLLPILREIKNNLIKLGRIEDTVNEELKPTLKNISDTTRTISKCADSCYQKFENTTRILGTLGIATRVFDEVSSRFRRERRRSSVAKLFGFIYGIKKGFDVFLGIKPKDKGGEK